MTDITKLKPCPFCGKEEALVHRPDMSTDAHPDITCHCCYCGAEAGSASTRECAIEKWNSRGAPKWTEITDNPDTWPIYDTRVVIALYEPDGDFYRTRTHRALARKGPPEQATHWRSLCDLDYPPDELNLVSQEQRSKWPDGFVEDILTLLDLIEMEDDASLARQRHRIAENHGLTVEIGEQVSGMIN